MHMDSFVHCNCRHALKLGIKRCVQLHDAQSLSFFLHSILYVTAMSHLPYTWPIAAKRHVYVPLDSPGRRSPGAVGLSPRILLPKQLSNADDIEFKIRGCADIHANTDNEQADEDVDSWEQSNTTALTSDSSSKHLDTCSCCCCRTNTHSDSSSLVYGAEPFEFFREKVYAEVESIWPIEWNLIQRLKKTLSGRLRWTGLGKIFRRFGVFRKSLQPEPSIDVYHMAGGGYNRIIGLRLLNWGQKWFQLHEDRDLIVRIPWDENTNPSRQVAAFKLVQEKTQIPVPKVVKGEFTGSNKLAKPYVIYEKIPGKALCWTWDEMTHEQRCLIARQVGSLMKKMQSTVCSKPGNIESHESDFKILPLDLKREFGPAGEAMGDEPEDAKQEGGRFDLGDHCTAGSFLKSLVARRQEWQKKFPGPDDMHMDTWKRVAEMIDFMVERQTLQQQNHCLCHLDFQSRNIMAHVGPDGTPKVTGVLDWDSAIIAPFFIGCAAPWWMWVGDEDHDEDDERRANDIPKTLEQAEIKAAFETVVGRDFLHYAYGRQFQILRLLFRWLHEGQLTYGFARNFWRLVDETWPEFVREIDGEGDQGESEDDSDDAETFAEDSDKLEMLLED